MATTKTVKNENPAPAKAPKAVVQDALQTTWLLKGNLKNAQLSYLRVGVLLAKVRDKKLYEALGHVDMDAYAQARLSLGRSSLYNYLRIHDWVAQSHPAWIQPKPKGFIPDLSDIGDLMWIESELARSKVSDSRRATLEELRQKGLEGKLSRSETQKLRRKENTVESGLKKVISQLRLIRRRSAQLANMPPEALAHLDSAIAILANDDALKVARLAPMTSQSEKWRGFLTA